MRAESLCISYSDIHTQNIEKAKACFATREKVAFLIFLTACNYLLSAPHGAIKTHDTAPEIMLCSSAHKVPNTRGGTAYRTLYRRNVETRILARIPASASRSRGQPQSTRRPRSRSVPAQTSRGRGLKIFKGRKAGDQRWGGARLDIALEEPDEVTLKLFIRH